ncbi:MAG: hypothetical protein HYR91_01495 [Flavobacteriia bacterium]|nr:hypothetical protein [Flavobacteriia bacterium]
MKNKSFSTIFGLIFSIIGIIVGILVHFTSNNSYNHFYIYSGISGFITAKLISKYIIEKRNSFNSINYKIVAILTGIFSHWLCWYIMILEFNFRYWILKEHSFSPPIDPFSGIFAMFLPCIFSWLFWGWATILGGFLSIYVTKWICKNKIIQNNI